MAEANKRSRKIHANRLCVGLGGIGYDPDAAICDIVDNAISAGAKNVYIKIVKLDDGLNDNRRNNVDSYLIIDDGSGMTQDELENALDIGSSEELYSEGTLSKFGLGLKSASFANGDRLEIISGKEGNFVKEYVDLQEIEDEYFSCVEALSPDDQELIDSFVHEHGTIVRVSKIRNIEHPSIKSVLDQLKTKLGVIYYYFIKDDGVQIHLLNESESFVVEPFDPLFVDEIDEDNDGGKLDEHKWDGRCVRWLMKRSLLAIDEVDGNPISVAIEMTQLPHPPTFQFEDRQVEVRDRYQIEAKNYGFYVYRNRRLISWADRLDGIIPLDQDFYSFRGRICIDETADDVFNINVSKNRISLSSVAEEALDDCVSLYKKKSKAAWNHAKEEVSRKSKEDTLSIANSLAAKTDPPESLPGEDEDSAHAHEAQRRADVLQEQQVEEMREEVSNAHKRNTGEELSPEEVSDSDIDSHVKGADVGKADRQIFRAEYLEDNILWEPYIDADPDLRDCVRISQSHRFSTLVYLDNAENSNMQVIVDLLLLKMAQAETYTIKNCQSYSAKEVETILSQYRANVSAYLSKMCKDLSGQLPPHTDAS